MNKFTRLPVSSSSTATDGTATSTIEGDGKIMSGGNPAYHQLELVGLGNYTGGTVTITCTTPSNSTAQAVYEADGSAMVINLATAGEPEARIVGPVNAKSFIATMASGAGSTDTWTLVVTGGE